MNVNPFANAAEGGSYAFSPDMLYQFKIDNTGDAREDLVIQVKFDEGRVRAQTSFDLWPRRSRQRHWRPQHFR